MNDTPTPDQPSGPPPGIPVLPTDCGLATLMTAEGPHLGMSLQTPLTTGLFCLDLAQVKNLAEQLGRWAKQVEKDARRPPDKKQLLLPAGADQALVVPGRS